MRKVLWVTDSLSHYRIDLFNSLADEVDLTIMHGSEYVPARFSQEKLQFWSLYGFKWISRFPEIRNSYDVVIVPFDLRLMNLYCAKRVRGKRMGVFGIGVRASYKNSYDSSLSDSILRMLLLRKLDFAIFYNNYPRIKYSGLGIPIDKLYVAPNTVAAPISFSLNQKTYGNFVFIGTLYPEKNVRQLIESYNQLYLLDSSLPYLDIIGNGPEFSTLSRLTRELGLSNKILFHGEVTQSTRLHSFLNNARVVISPGQAGLSVLQAFSYATGFITCENAKTGGELYNIVDGITGAYFNGTTRGLSNVLKLYVSESYAREIGENSFRYYYLLRHQDNWVNNVLRAIRHDNFN